MRTQGKKNHYFKFIFYLGCIFLCVATSWAMLQKGMKSTGGVDFCSSCHSMQPIAFAYRQDVHGGKNLTGFQAKCVDCHLPQDSTMHYLTRKISLATHDVFTEFLTDTDQIDWQAKREEREHFTYDSGCVQCHGYLEKAPLGNTRAVVAHKPYYAGQSHETCVSCHPNVGHQMLDELLTQTEDH